MGQDPREAYQRLQRQLTQRLKFRGGGLPGGGAAAGGGAALFLVGLGAFALSQSLYNG